jgi:hypothetical protein
MEKSIQLSRKQHKGEEPLEKLGSRPATKESLNNVRKQD